MLKGMKKFWCACVWIKEGEKYCDNAAYAKKMKWVMSGKRREELETWMKKHNLSTEGIVKELKMRIKGSEVYHKRRTPMQKLFSTHSHCLPS